MKFLSIRWRLTFWYAASLALLLAIFSGLIYGLMRDRLLSRTDFELEEELDELALELELAESWDELLRQLRLRFSEHNTFEFQVVDSKGTRWFASRGLLDIDVPAPANFTGADQLYENLSLPLLGDCRMGSQRVDAHGEELILQTILPLGRYLAELHDLRRLMLLVGPLMLAAAVGGGAWLARRALEPVDQMTAAAAQINARRLDERLAVDNPHDELGRLAITFNDMLERLQQAFDELRQFTADAAHELRTPLAVIRSTAEVALHTPRSVEHYQECLQSVVEESARLAELSNSLLTLAREDAGLDEAGDEVDLGQLVEQVVADLEPLAEEKSQKLRCPMTPGVLVIGDAIRLRRVFLNLLDNAIKFTPETGTVAVLMSSSDQQAVVSITDTGVGIPADHLSRVCERFYRVDASRDRDTGGAGLGLAISRAIVERHGGQMFIASCAGQGTQVRVEIPLAQRITGSYRIPHELHPAV